MMLALASCLGLLLPPAPSHAAASPPAIDAPAAFAVLRGLEGTWKGTDGAGHPMVVEFSTHAHGTMVQETQSPAKADEMVSVYSIVDGELTLVHYCPMGMHGNQPHMRLDPGTSTASDLRFVFSRLDNSSAATDMHVHAGRIRVLDRDHIERQWEVFEGGKKVTTETFRLAREQGAR